MKKDNTQKALFALLRSGLWNTSLSDESLFNSTTDWNGILENAKKQTVLGLVADAILRLPNVQQPSKPLLIKLVGFQSSIARSHASLNNVAALIVALMNSKGIDSVLLKGQGIATMYHTPTLRMCGDIDLYVGMKDYTRACKIIMQIDDKNKEAIESEKHFHTSYNNVSVEIHRIAETLYNPIHNIKYQHWSKEGLRKENTTTIQLKGTTINIPSPEFNAIYIFNHLWHHFISGGIGLRQLCDWTMTLHACNGKLNLEQTKKHLKEFGLWEAWGTFGCIIVRELGLKKEEFPFYDIRGEKKADKILEQILFEGNFGKYNPSQKGRPDGIIAGKLHSLRRITKRTVGVAAISPLKALEYYISFIHNGIIGLFETLLGIRRSYMKKERK